MERRKLVIIGAGPAGLTAAIYAARAYLAPFVFEGFLSGVAGGQLMTTTEVENFPGFPQSIAGPTLMEGMKEQAQRFGAEILPEDVESVDLAQRPFLVRGSQRAFMADSIIVATGAVAKRLDVPGARDGEFWQRGVTACAVCDGALPIFRDRELYVIGGGDTAAEEAIFLTKYASKVYIVHRRDKLRASEVMAQRVMEHPKIEILWSHVLKGVEGDEVVTGVSLENLEKQKEIAREAAGVFFAIGHSPNTKFLEGQVEIDNQGYLVVESGTTHTSVEGVFAAGDVQDKVYRQAVSAAGSGCMAALDVERFLTAQGT